jgi:hypothetical protein
MNFVREDWKYLHIVFVIKISFLSLKYVASLINAHRYFNSAMITFSDRELVRHFVVTYVGSKFKFNAQKNEIKYETKFGEIKQ